MDGSYGIMVYYWLNPGKGKRGNIHPSFPDKGGAELFGLFEG
jgi:hypothetical protein